MTGFVTTDIPATVTTLEKLAVWVATALNHINPTSTAVEATGVAERTVSTGPFYIVADSPAKWRNIARQSIILSSNFQRSGKIWEHAQEISTIALPAEFKS